MWSIMRSRACPILSAAVLFLGASQAAWADEFSDRIARISQIANDASGRMSRLQGAALSRAQTLHGDLLAKKLELDRLAGELSARQSRIQSQQGTSQFLKVEWETAEAAYKRAAEAFQRKEAELKGEADVLKRDSEAYQRDVNDHNQRVRDFSPSVGPLDADLRSYEQDVRSHNQDAAAQRDAVSYYNSLPANQRSQAEHDRLNRWGATVNNRKANLDVRLSYLNTRIADSNRQRQALNDRKAPLDQRAAQLRERGRGLTQRAQTAITNEGKTMLDLRLAASTKRRAYTDGNAELQRLQAAQQQQIGAFNAAYSQADVLGRSLETAVAQSGPGAGTTGTTVNSSPAPAAVKIDTRNLAGLDPVFRAKVENVMRALVEKGWRPHVASGRRTQAEQDEIVRKGNSTVHQSAHLYGLGADIVDRRWGWDQPRSHQFWRDLRDAAVAQGLTAGYDWANLPLEFAHVEMPGWQTRIPKK